ncbi:MAG: DUF1801 domain-containing protein [Phycisphaerales bacterium]
MAKSNSKKKSTSQKTTTAHKPKKKQSNKTVATKESASSFLKSVPDKYKEDCETLTEMMSSITKAPPVMWGASIVGFGEYHYVYDSGREGDFMLTGFSPRASAISVYIMSGFEHYPELLEKLGKYKLGKSCLYIKKLEDIHMPTLKKLIRESVKRTQALNS